MQLLKSQRERGSNIYTKALDVYFLEIKLTFIALSILIFLHNNNVYVLLIESRSQSAVSSIHSKSPISPNVLVTRKIKVASSSRKKKLGNSSLAASGSETKGENKKTRTKIIKKVIRKKKVSKPYWKAFLYLKLKFQVSDSTVLFYFLQISKIGGTPTSD